MLYCVPLYVFYDLSLQQFYIFMVVLVLVFVLHMRAVNPDQIMTDNGDPPTTKCKTKGFLQPSR